MLRPATHRLVLTGRRYDGRVYWPEKTRIHVLSYTDEEANGIYQVNVEVYRGDTEKKEKTLQGKVKSESVDAGGQMEFFVDSQCLRQCLVFHWLAHASMLIAEDVRGVVEDELRDGMVELEVREDDGGRVISHERWRIFGALEEKLVECVVGRSEYMKQQVDLLGNMLKLGDLYLSMGDEEILDSGHAEDNPAVGAALNIYDAPLHLGDDNGRIAAQVQRLLAMSQGIGG